MYFLYKDVKKLAAQFADTEPDFEQKMKHYPADCQATFNDTINLVIKRNFGSLLGYVITLMRVNPKHIPKLFRTFWKHVGRYFSDSEARQIVSLVSFFLGRTPFDTSAIYTLLSYTEIRHNGYFNVKGGMYNITEGIVNELTKHNVNIVYNTEITCFETEKNQISSLIDREGKKWTADVFLINADAAVFRGRVFGKTKFSEQKMKKLSWTMGYLTFYVGLKCKLPQVNHHNYFLGKNYEEYAERILKNPELTENPYYYVNVLSKYNRDCAPEGCESLFFVCPVPNMQYKPDWSDKHEIAEKILKDFSERIDQNIMDEIVTLTVYSPKEWGEQYNLQYGSGLGLSHKIKQIGALRPKNYDEDYKNVFYTGASTVPGAGLPMAIISSKLAYERITDFF